jgi:hypothetical protein
VHVSCACLFVPFDRRHPVCFLHCDLGTEVAGGWQIRCVTQLELSSSRIVFKPTPAHSESRCTVFKFRNTVRNVDYHLAVFKKLFGCHQEIVRLSSRNCLQLDTGYILAGTARHAVRVLFSAGMQGTVSGFQNIPAAPLLQDAAGGRPG